MKTDIKTLLEFAGVDITQGKARKLIEMNSRKLIIRVYNLNNIDREEPTDSPPIHTEEVNTNATDIQSAVREYKESEGGRFDETDGEIGADGSWYEMGEEMLRYTLK